MMHIARILLVVLVLVMRALSSTAHAHDRAPSTPPGLSEAGRAASGAPGAGPLAVLTGQLHLIYGDAAPGQAPGGTLGFVLLEDTGQLTELVVPDHVLAAAGGRTAVNRQRVTVTGQAPLLPPGAAVGARSLLLVQALHGAGGEGASALAAAAAVTGPQPWVTILCRFADQVAVTPHPVSWFETLMLGGAAAPSLDHYWRELSYGQVQLTGSDVVGWYTLPQPRSYYVYGTPEVLDHQRAVDDCTAVADADVYFPGFVGINLAFNADLDCCAWGGSWTLNRDGQSRSYRVTWLPPWAYENQGPVAHEMGHGFGLPHSSGPYSATYDSAWDVMSGQWDNCPPYDSVYGCVGTHTIAYHKDLLGWIPDDRRYVAADGTSQTITLEPLGVPATANYLIAKIPIGSSTTQFYTAEVRRFFGYDATLPGEAVVIHRVDTTLSDRDAQVVDPDGNGNPDDSGARWLTGETFLDSVNGISVTVVGQTLTGFQVTVAKAVSSYTLTISPVSRKGTITGPGISCGKRSTDCTEAFAPGTAVVLTATPPRKQRLGSWTGCDNVSGNQCTVNMTQPRTVSATFVPQ